ncbi:MAG TPA: ankyrin repeat domain-containing protein, partial [Armatimonadota bacterium]
MLRQIIVVCVLVACALGGSAATPYPDEHGAKQIIDAAQRGDLARVKALVASDSRLANAADRGRKTPLHLAAYAGRDDVVKFLLAAGADPNAEANMKGTPLHLAVMGDHVETVKILLAHGANPNSKDGVENTPLYYAMARNRTAIIQVLKAAGSRVDADKLPLSKPEEDFLKSVQSHNYAAMAKALKANPQLAKFVNPNGTCRSGICPLHIAASQGDLKTMGLLLSSGANVDQKTDCHTSNRVNNHDIHFPEGSTPLYMALSIGHWDAAALLLQHGAVANAFAVLHFSPEEQFQRLLKLHPEWLRDVLGDQSTLVHWAVQARKIQALRLLIALGANVNAKTAGPWEQPLHWAARINAADAADVLVKAGAELNAGSEFGATPLYVAASNGSYAVALVLLKNGANPNLSMQFSSSARGYVLRSPVDIARMNG